MNETIQTLLTAFTSGSGALVETVVAGLLPLIAYRLNAWVKAYATDQRENAALSRLSKHAEQAVIDTQAFVKRTARAHDWNDEAAEKARKRARELVSTALGDHGRKELRRALRQSEAGVARLIDAELEASLARLKTNLTIDSTKKRVVANPNASFR